MASSIDPAVPVAGAPTTASVRANFAAAKSEIEAVQAALALLAPLDAPAFTGTLTAAGTAILGGTAGAEGLRVVPAPGADARVEIQGAQTAAGARPRLGVAGTGADIGLSLSSKGGAGITFYTGGFTAGQLAIGHVPGAVNHLQLTGAPSGAAPAIAVHGADAAIDLWLVPKGSGLVRFGTHAGSADGPVNGFVTIRDGAGNTRKLATIA
ncbi:hypothetical protein [Arenibaculum pallidiluteum]|uniref:hypothetical protein n=1 Tax=Arenibaculum pallidiluteum TaxID=2812559 RepID=UPI001A97AB46|nr:hypothetical protein [Arenibaculum pallidiluteum]